MGETSMFSIHIQYICVSQKLALLFYLKFLEKHSEN